MKEVKLDGFWLPRSGSTLAPEIDFGWNVAMWLSIFFFVGIIGALVIFVMKYKRRSENDVTSTVDHNLPIEITWTVIPSVLCVLLFLVGFKGFIHAQVAPAGAMEINVTAQRWSWLFTYANGVEKDNMLVVPKGKPVRLIMSSRDVLHSLYIPEFRVKTDLVPGNYTTLWFEATEAGETTLFCTEYCGMSHSDMLAHVKVLEPAEFEKWLSEEASAKAKGLPPEELGKNLYTGKGCNACHSLDGTPGAGPSFKGLFGKEETLADGTTAKVDENYLRESILTPAAKLVKGFPPVMPTFQGQLKDEDVAGLIAFIKAQK
ncbi:MAG: cytochrome c oxidase subunit II [Myxococcota bacterium]